MDSNFNRALRLAQDCVDEYLEENNTNGINAGAFAEICTFAGVISGVSSNELDMLHQEMEKLYHVFYSSDS